MAEWKKVVVSGSAVSQLNNDSGYLISGQSAEVTLSGSFSGSFQGDGSNLSGITADVLGNSLTDGNGISDFSFDGSGAASVAVQADGSTLSVGASGVKVADAGITATQLNTSIAGDGLSGGAGTALSVNVDETSITTSGDNLTLAGTTFSSSVDNRIGAAQSLASANSASLAALDATYATDASVSLVAATASAENTALSSSIATTIGNLDSIYATDASVSLVAATASADNTTLSSSIATTTDALDGRVDSLETDSHTHSNKANLDQINQDLGTSDDVTFNDVVVSGDLTVSGTTTTLNTTNLLVEDKFILLNSGSADPDEGGLIIDEGAGSGHAFIYDKGDTRWGFNASVASDASTANATAHVAAVVDIQNVAHSDSAEYQKNGNIKVDNGDIFIYC